MNTIVQLEDNKNFESQRLKQPTAQLKLNYKNNEKVFSFGVEEKCTK